VVFDLDLATDYGSRGESTGGVVRGRFHVAAVPVAGLEHSDENAALQAGRLGRPERGPWPEQLLGLLTEFGSRLGPGSR
jgi:hypothetical protein